VQPDRFRTAAIVATLVTASSLLVRAAAGQPNPPPVAPSPVATQSTALTAGPRTAPDDPYFADQWALHRIDAPGAWRVTRGSPSIVVAILNTAVYQDHEDLQGRFGSGANFLSRGEAEVSPEELAISPGTLVAGVIAAVHNDRGISGLAPMTSLMPITTLSLAGEGLDTDMAAGIRWAADHGARVILLGAFTHERVERVDQAIGYARERGAIVVGTAGTRGRVEPVYPAASPGVIAVAGTDMKDGRPWWSNRGPWIHIAAPSEEILSTSALGGNEYRRESGPGVAAAHVAGVIALMLAAAPALAECDVLSILKQTADPLEDSGLGAGRVNAARAVTAAAAFATTPTPALSPTARPTSTPELRMLQPGLGIISPPPPGPALCP
jgi:subtilisin family serine protease